MKLKFKVQAFQTNAVDSVVDCFAGQPRSEGISYRIDPGPRRCWVRGKHGWGMCWAMRGGQVIK